jgi:tape measure domain-containing protein
MSSIDERIAKLTLDNKTFENNAKTTLETLKTLNNNLKLDGVKGGLNQLSKLSQVGAFDSLRTGIQGLQDKFSALSIAGITALTNITNKAVDAGIQLTKSLTIDPVMEGFGEYETKMGSIQTILANTSKSGTTLEDVTGILEELNEYSDKTIYSFSEMTKNIGTFTAAGLGLDESAEAIKGIANLAALSGSNSQQASTAMYQLSQALSSGTVRAQDWISVTNAGMGGQVFQDALLDTAIAMGTLEATSRQSTLDDFRGSLQNGWLSSEVLSTTLRQFTGDMSDAELAAIGFSEESIAAIQKQAEIANDAATLIKTATQLMGTLKETAGSGWATSFEIIVGDFEQARALFTEIGGAIGGILEDQANARNAILQSWADLGGREDLIQSMRNVFGGLWNIVEAVRKAFERVFPPITGQQLADITSKVEWLTGKFYALTENLDWLTNVLSGILSIFKLVSGAVGAVFAGIGILIDRAILPLIGYIGSLIGDAGSGMGGLITKFQEFVFSGELAKQASEKINKAFDKIEQAITPILQRIKEFVESTIDWLSQLPEVFKTFSKSIQEVGAGTKDVFSNMKDWMGDAFNKVGEVLDTIKEKLLAVKAFFQPVIDAAAKVGDSIVTSFKNMMSNKDFNIDDIFTAIAGAGLGALLFKLKDLASGVKDITDGIGEVLSGFGDVLNSFSLQVKAEALLKIAAAVAVLAAAILVLSTIDPVKLATATAGMTAALADLVAGIAVLSKVDGTGFGLAQTTIALGLIAAALITFGAAIKIFATLSWEDIAQGLTTSTVALATFVGAIVAMDKTTGTGSRIAKTAAALNLISTAMILFGAAMKIFASMDWQEIAKGLIASAGGLILFVKSINSIKNGEVEKSSIAMNLMAFSLRLLASAIALFVAFTWAELAEGFLAVALGLSMMGKSFSKLPADVDLLKAAGAMDLMATSMIIMAGAVALFANMDWITLAKGFGSIAVGLGLFVAALKLMPDNATVVKAAGAMNLMAIAVGMLVPSILLLGQADLDTLAKGIYAIGGALTVLVGALAIMGIIDKTGGQLAATAAGFILMATAVNLLVPPMLILSQLSWGELAIAIAAMAGALGVFLVAGALAEKVAIGLLALATAIGIMGAAFLAVGVGMATFAAGLTTLTLLGPAAGAVIIAAILAIAAVLPTLGAAMATALGAFILAILEAIPEILIALTALIQPAFVLIQEAVNAIIDLIVDTLTHLGQKLADAAPEWKQYAITIGTNFLTALRVLTPQWIALIVETLAALVEELAANAPRFKESAVTLILEFLTGLNTIIPDVVETIFNFITELLWKLAERLPEFIDAGMTMITDLLNGIANKLPDVIDAGVNLVTKFLEGVGQNIDEIASAAFQLVIDLINGISTAIDENYQKMKEAVKNLIDTIGRVIGDMWSDLKDIGKDIIRGIVAGVKSMATDLANSVKDAAKGAVDGVKDFLGIASPSKLYQYIGEMQMAGLIKGTEIEADKYIRNSARPIEMATDQAIKLARASGVSLEAIFTKQLTRLDTMLLASEKARMTALNGKNFGGVVMDSSYYAASSDVAKSSRNSAYGESVLQDILQMDIDPWIDSMEGYAAKIAELWGERTSNGADINFDGIVDSIDQSYVDTIESALSRNVMTLLDREELQSYIAQTENLVKEMEEVSKTSAWGGKTNDSAYGMGISDQLAMELANQRLSELITWNNYMNKRDAFDAETMVDIARQKQAVTTYYNQYISSPKTLSAVDIYRQTNTLLEEKKRAEAEALAASRK